MTTKGQVLGVVPARGGSQGIPGKNIRQLGGRPLLAYALEVATRSGVVDRVILSTDSEEIAGVGRTCGFEVPFLRPADLAGGRSPMLAVIEHAVATLEADGWSPEIVIVLQPTSPFRRSEHVRRAVQLLRESKADSVVSVVELPRHFSPDYVMRLDDWRLVPFLPAGERVTRRQDARRAYVRDGTVYACWRRTLVDQHSLYGRACQPLVLDASDALTLDSQDDWAEAERRMAKGLRL